MSSNGDSGVVVRAGEGPSFWVAGDHVTFKLRGDQTGGRFALAETIVPVGGGPPPHIHGREDEMFYVIDGELAFFRDGRIIRGSAGFATYLPKGGLHTFKNMGNHPARFLVAAVPSGFEQFVADAGCPCTDPASPPTVGQAEFGKLMSACALHGLQMRPDVQLPDPTATGAAQTSPSPRAFWVRGQHVTLRLIAGDTRGNFSLAELTSRPGTGVPAHSHRTIDEIFHVLEGTFEFQINGVQTLAPPGTTVFVPRGVTHGFRNVATSTARLVDYHTPAGFEQFFEEAGTPCMDADSPPPDLVPDEGALRALF